MKETQKTVTYTSNREKAQQKNANRKKRRRKGKYILYYLFFLFFALTAVAVLSMTVFFSIESFQVEDTGIYSQEDIIGSSGIQIGDNLIRTDMKRAQKIILKNHIYLDSVLVKRVFPSIVEIKCTPAVVTYSYHTDSGYIYVSQSGRVLEVDQPQPAPNSFTISGVEIASSNQGDFITTQNQKELDKFNTLQTQIKEIGLDGVTGIELDGDGANIIYQDRIVIEIDSWDHATYILNASKKILDAYIGVQEKGKILYESSNQSIHFVPEN